MKLGFIVAVVLVLAGFYANAGGVYCRECPAESSGCAPRPDCYQDQEQANVCANAGGDCAQQQMGTACKSGENQQPGTCRLLPLTAGGIFGHCLCYPNQQVPEQFSEVE